MAWTTSKVFATYITDLFNNTTAMDLNTDALLEVALFDNSQTPDNTVASASSAYATGQWAAGHQTDTGSSAPAGWPTLGRPLVSASSTFAGSLYTFDAADTVSANSVTTLTGAYGCLIYDHSAGTVTDQGICFLYFGGVASVTLGTFTVSWSGSGIFSVQT